MPLGLECLQLPNVTVSHCARPEIGRVIKFDGLALARLGCSFERL